MYNLRAYRTNKPLRLMPTSRRERDDAKWNLNQFRFSIEIIVEMLKSSSISRELMFRIISPYERTYKKVFTIVEWKQKGLCLKCKQLIDFGQVIISNSNKNTKYYHEDCAKLVMIIRWPARAIGQSYVVAISIKWIERSPLNKTLYSRPRICGKICSWCAANLSPRSILS